MEKARVKSMDKKQDIESKEEHSFKKVLYNLCEYIILVKLGKDDLLESIVDVNTAFCQDFAYTKEEILSTSSNQLASCLQDREIEDLLREILHRSHVSFNSYINTKLGETIFLEINAHILMAVEERYILVVMKNIEKTSKNQNQLLKYNNELIEALEDLKRAKDQLVQQEKLVGIGQLAAGVAHEINNPLGYISSNIETSKEYFSKYNDIFNNYKNLIHRLPDLSREEIKVRAEEIASIEEEYNMDFISKDLEEIFEDVEDGLDRINEIILSLRSFSRIDETIEMEEYNLIEGIENTLIMAKSEIYHHARVVKQFKEIPVFKAFGNQVNQVLLNIILNASHAIKAKNLEEMGLIIIKSYQKENYVTCEIEDNGIGIEEENINKIFNPFFTTKPIGKGTGLGLSIAHDIIVNKHGGELSVESVAMKGTKFTIKLPLISLNNHIIE